MGIILVDYFGLRCGIMKNDIEIAQSAKMEPIINIAKKIGLGEDDIELYGK